MGRACLGGTLLSMFEPLGLKQSTRFFLGADLIGRRAFSGAAGAAEATRSAAPRLSWRWMAAAGKADQACEPALGRQSELFSRNCDRPRLFARDRRRPHLLGRGSTFEYANRRRWSWLRPSRRRDPRRSFSSYGVARPGNGTATSQGRAARVRLERLPRRSRLPDLVHGDGATPSQSRGGGASERWAARCDRRRLSNRKPKGSCVIRAAG
jgi:hypothetical protein